MINIILNRLWVDIGPPKQLEVFVTLVFFIGAITITHHHNDYSPHKSLPRAAHDTGLSYCQLFDPNSKTRLKKSKTSYSNIILGM